jgi:hypothetical protein
MPDFLHQCFEQYLHFFVSRSLNLKTFDTFLLIPMTLLQKRTFTQSHVTHVDEDDVLKDPDSEDESDAWELYKQEKRKPYGAEQFAMDRELHRRIWYKTIHGEVPPRRHQTTLETMPAKWKSRVCIPNINIECHCENHDDEFCDEDDPSFEFYAPCPLEGFCSIPQGHITDVQVTQDPEDAEMAKVTVQVYFPDVEYATILYFHEYFPWSALADPEDYLVSPDCCWDTYVGDCNDHQYRMNLTSEQHEALEKIVRQKATQL